MGEFCRCIAVLFQHEVDVCSIKKCIEIIFTRIGDRAESVEAGRQDITRFSVFLRVHQRLTQRGLPCKEFVRCLGPDAGAGGEQAFISCSGGFILTLAHEECRFFSHCLKVVVAFRFKRCKIFNLCVDDSEAVVIFLQGEG